VVLYRVVSSCYGANKVKERQKIRVGIRIVGMKGLCWMNRGWMRSWARNTENIHSLEVGQCKVIGSKKHPWVEEGKV